MSSLFENDSLPPSVEALEPGAVLLRGFAAGEAATLVQEVERIARAAPFRHLVTPGGYTMSVAMTNCGRVGWVSDRAGYRYDAIDPDAGAPWPAMPEQFVSLAKRAAAEAGFPAYDPGRVSDQPLCRGRQTQPPPGPGRARRLGAHRLRLAGTACRLLMGRPAPLGSAAPSATGKRRRGRLGRPGALCLSRCRSAQGRAASAHGGQPPESHIPKGVLKPWYRDRLKP